MCVRSPQVPPIFYQHHECGLSPRSCRPPQEVLQHGKNSISVCLVLLGQLCSDSWPARSCNLWCMAKFHPSKQANDAPPSLPNLRLGPIIGAITDIAHHFHNGSGYEWCDFFSEGNQSQMEPLHALVHPDPSVSPHSPPCNKDNGYIWRNAK